MKEIKLFKYNRTTYAINSTFELLVDLTDKFSFKHELYGMMGNEFRRMLPDMIEEKMCSHIRRWNHLYKDIIEYTNLAPKNLDICPVTKGIYWTRNYVIRPDELPNLPFNCKKLKSVWTFFYQNEFDIQLAFYVVEDI